GEAAGDVDRGAVVGEGWAERVADATDEGRGLVVVLRPERQDDELVPADPRDGVARAHDVFETPCERAEDGVARAVAAQVVDVLEPVEVDDDERERLAVPARAPERLLDPVLEQDTVREARQRGAERVTLLAVPPPVAPSP